MSNKALLQEWFDRVWNGRDASTVNRLLAVNSTSHGLGSEGGDTQGPAGFDPVYKSFLGAMNDLHITVEDLIEEGDRVVARWTLRGTLTGDTLGVPATGKSVTMAGVSIARFANGQVIESWNVFDTLHMHRQLGTLQHLLR